MDVNTLKEMGYSVYLSREGYTDPTEETDIPAVWRVQGFGIDIMLNEDDEESWTRLSNKDAHKLREADPDMSISDRTKLDFAAKVSLGDMTQKEADKQLKEELERVRS